jgi:hypothetical protein
MTNSPADSRAAAVSTRRGLGITAVIMGAIATLMIVGFQVIAAGADGQGLSNAVVIAVVLFYGSVAIGAVAALLGIAAAIFARPRLLGVVAIVLGVIPVVVVTVSPSLQG